LLLLRFDRQRDGQLLNLARRHLDYYAKRQIITDELRENSARSNNWIAKSLGVDDKTVASVRREMQSTSEIPKLGFTLGSDGKYRPATRGSLPRNGDGRLASEQDYIDLDDEEGILRAATVIRQQRIALRGQLEAEKQSWPEQLLRAEKRIQSVQDERRATEYQTGEFWAEIDRVLKMRTITVPVLHCL